MELLQLIASAGAPLPAFASGRAASDANVATTRAPATICFQNGFWTWISC